MKKSFCFLSQPISDANDEISLVKLTHRLRRLIGRLMFFTSEKWSNGKLGAKTRKDKDKKTKPLFQRHKALQTFIETKNELTEVEEIPAGKLNDLCELIISVRTKYGRLWAFFAPIFFFTINMNTVNHSPKLTQEECSLATTKALPRWKRLRLLDNSDDE